jgi:hypothetical protein
MEGIRTSSAVPRRPRLRCSSYPPWSSFPPERRRFFRTAALQDLIDGQCRATSEEATWLFVFLYRSRRAEVKSTSSRHRFLIALCSPESAAESGLLRCLPEKKPANSFTGFGETLSPVRFHRDSCEILPISRNFQRSLGGFLCVPDCVAERMGFELSVRFLEPSRYGAS